MRPILYEKLKRSKAWRHRAHKGTRLNLWYPNVILWEVWTHIWGSIPTLKYKTTCTMVPSKIPSLIRKNHGQLLIESALHSLVNLFNKNTIIFLDQNYKKIREQAFPFFMFFDLQCQRTYSLCKSTNFTYFSTILVGNCTNLPRNQKRNDKWTKLLPYTRYLAIILKNRPLVINKIRGSKSCWKDKVC